MLVPREPPLAPVAVLGAGRVARSLTDVTRERLAAGAALRGATSGHYLVVLGDDLPWVDGCRYLGRDGDLYVPTTHRLKDSPDLVAAAIELRADELVVVLEDVLLRCPMPRTPIDRDRLL